MEAKSISNNRSEGSDLIPGEAIKYASDETYQLIADIFNDIFKYHESPENLKHGILVPLNKPNKRALASNTRPIILLSAFRKLLSKIVLRRISQKVDSFLPSWQHAYRTKRSTTEIIWTFQFVLAMTEKFQEAAQAMGIDLSKAFDCLDRSKLMDILARHQLANEDELRIIQYLLSNTSIQIRVDGELGNSFSTSIGTPQGDALSPVLFLIYLAEIMKTSADSSLFHDSKNITVAYADDVTCIIRETLENRNSHQEMEACQCATCTLKKVNSRLADHMSTFNMQLNVEKTTYGELIMGNSRIGQVLGCHLEGRKDLISRKRKAAAAFNSMKKLFLGNHMVSTKTKVRLYNTMVLPHLLYNSATMVYKQTELDKLESFHRSQLRRLLGIFYPTRMSDKLLYETTETRPLSLEIIRSRWAMLGHISRLPQDAPAQKCMETYFRDINAEGTAKSRGHKGRPKTTLPILLHQDLAKLHSTDRSMHFSATEFTSKLHLKNIQSVARNPSRDKWTNAINFLVSVHEKIWQRRNTRQQAARKVYHSSRVTVNGATATHRGRGRGRGRRSNQGRQGSEQIRGRRGRGRSRGRSQARNENHEHSVAQLNSQVSTRARGRGRSRGGGRLANRPPNQRMITNYFTR
jgi:hypothetical protein